jgi:hypothetical protein
MSGSVIVIVVAVFFLPVVPVEVNVFCIYCAGVHEAPVTGYASVALDLFGYGGILVIRGGELSNEYCVVYGNALGNSCGFGVGLA